jgi:poly-gamma-glutamate system protein
MIQSILLNKMNKIFLRKKDRVLYGLFAISLVFFLMAKIVPPHQAKPIREEMIAASQVMFEAMEALKRCRGSKGLGIDSSSDVNRTGVIGERFSSITTTLGNLEAKRTSTNPNFAGLMVSLLRQAGIDSEDTVAVGASGSFPGLILAVLAAAKTMDLKLLFLASIGASQWGANHPDFHWLHMQACLQREGIFSFAPLAISMGGDGDVGRDMQEEGRVLLARDMAEAGYPIVSEGELEKNVESKMRLYLQNTSNKKIKAFVNIGGSWSNLGIDSEILRLRPGLGRITRIPPENKRGVLYAMAALDVPVIHLLYVRGLVQRYGLPWDPVPLPQPGEGDVYRRVDERQDSFLWISIVYVVLIGSFLAGAVYLRRRRIATP